MTSQPHPPKPVRLRGLDPGRLLELLDEDIIESKPSIPGWRILGVAGQGGSGIVWRAVRKTDETTAAIKIAPVDEPDTVERIEREAGFLRELRHPNIVSLLETGPLQQGEGEGGLYLAMEFIDGPPLAQEIPEDGLPPAKAYQWFREIAAAVAHAHECGILHRDLKPSNVLLAPDGHVRVADFGLARPVHRRVHMLSLTRAGLVAGTAEYLPPEAYRRDYQPGPAADIFALGVMLHEMLTGTPPRGAWQPASSQRGVDVRIDGLIRRAMDPDPEKRWPDANAMLAELDRILGTSPRYSGTPLVTFPIRVADCLWSVLGLLVSISAFSSLLNMRKAKFSLPLDLVGDHAHLVGGFNALFILLLPCVPLALWQIIRLWRFRHIPMREALPSPFGVKLGHGKTAVWLVIICQFLCFLLPLLLLLTIYTDSCLIWLKPDDPPWVRGLSVTTSKNQQEIISPWEFRDGKQFWLHESGGPPGHPLTVFVDRIGFFPGYVPLIMVIGGGLMASTLVATLLTACSGWWHRDRRLHVIGSLVMMGVFATQVGMGHRERFRGAERAINRSFDGYVEARITEHLIEFAAQLILRRSDPSLGPEPSRVGSFYAPVVNYRGHGNVGRGLIAGIMREEPLPSGRVFHETLRRPYDWTPGSGRFHVYHECLEYRDTGDAASACRLKLTLRGIVTRHGHTEIRSERLEIIPLYQAQQRVADHSVAIEWAEKVDRACSGAGGSFEKMSEDLEPLFARKIEQDPALPGERLVRFESHPHLDVLSMLLEQKMVSDPAAARVLGPQPGGRTRIAIPLRDPRKGGSRDLTVDLISRENRWLAVGLAF